MNARTVFAGISRMLNQPERGIGWPMKSENRIKKELDRINRSRYRRHYAESIAMLEWVLGITTARQARMMNIIQEENIKERQAKGSEG